MLSRRRCLGTSSRSDQLRRGPAPKRRRGWIGLIRILDRRKQVILYGPPGTGKTFIAQALAEHLTDEGNVTLVQFHPSYAYETSSWDTDRSPAIRISGDSAARGWGSGLRFALKNGPLMRIAEQARDNKGVPHVLIIDEINRANLAKVLESCTSFSSTAIGRSTCCTARTTATTSTFRRTCS